MAFRYEKIYGTDSSKTVYEILNKICENMNITTETEDLRYPIIRLSWGSEYVDFIISNPSRKLLFPQEGSEIVFRKWVQIKEYTFEEFYRLTPRTYLQVFEQDFKLELDKYFKKIQINRYDDYPRMITDLENEEVVETIPSNNIMATDRRRFKFLPKIKEIEQKAYTNEFYEVDTLGSSLFQELSHYVTSSWSWYMFTKAYKS